MGAAPTQAVERAARMLGAARMPVLLLGVRAGAIDATAAIRRLLALTELPVVETFQAPGRCPADWRITTSGGSDCFATSRATSCWPAPT